MSKSSRMQPRDIRGWYAKQLGGPTFNLADPIVEVLHSEKAAAWFTTHPNGKDEESWGFYNTLDEMKRMRDVRPSGTAVSGLSIPTGRGTKGEPYRALPIYRKMTFWGWSASIPRRKIPSAGSPEWATNWAIPSVWRGERASKDTPI